MRTGELSIACSTFCLTESQPASLPKGQETSTSGSGVVQTHKLGGACGFVFGSQGTEDLVEIAVLLYEYVGVLEPSARVEQHDTLVRGYPALR
jgi:hypothetical protein